MPFFYNLSALHFRHESFAGEVRTVLSEHLEQGGSGSHDYTVSIVPIPQRGSKIPLEYRVLIKVGNQSVIPDTYDIVLVFAGWKIFVERRDK